MFWKSQRIFTVPIDSAVGECYNIFNQKVKRKGGEAVSIQNTMKTLADPTRRAVLNLLKSGALSAGDIAGHFDMSMAAVSKHLSVLKEADLVRIRRDGKYIYYELNASVLDEALLWLKDLRGE